MNRKADDKITHQRFSVLELVKTLGNVSGACRRRDISCQTVHEYKRRFDEHGIEGLKDQSTIPKSRPSSMSSDYWR